MGGRSSCAKGVIPGQANSACFVFKPKVLRGLVKKRSEFIVVSRLAHACALTRPAREKQSLRLRIFDLAYQANADMVGASLKTGA